MNPSYAYTPEIWPPLGAAVFLLTLSLYSWKRRSVPAALPLLAGALVGIGWLIGAALGAAAIAPAYKIVWHKYQAAWQTPAAITSVCLALEYTYPGRWLNRRRLAWLALFPLVVLLLIASFDAQLMWRSLQVGADGRVLPYYTGLGWALVVVGLGLVLVNVAVLLWLWARSPQHRWPAALMLFAQLAGRAVLMSTVARLSWPLALDPSVAVIIVVWTVHAIALFGFRILDPLPVASRTALEQMRDGIIVCDTRGRILSLNPAAQSVLGVPTAQAHGQALGAWLPDLPDLPTLNADAAVASCEFSHAVGGARRHYGLDLQPLQDFRGLLIGHLLMLRDMTEQKKAQAERIEQQRALAVLREREQLARELHDSLSQSLAYINLQAQAVELFRQAGQVEDEGVAVARLAQVARELQNDTRAMIGQLRDANPCAESIVEALRGIVERFRRQTGLVVELQVDPDVARLCGRGQLSSTVVLQISRVVQEALANVSKHAGQTSAVHMWLSAEDGELRLGIADDGVGFLVDLKANPGDHYGLRMMQERVEGVGGELQVASAPGQGTRVEVSVPFAAA